MRSLMSKSAVLCAALLLVVGCNTDPPKVAPVKPEAAMAALKTTLDAWKAGETIDSLQSKTPKITAQDFDWMGGKKLTSYEIVGEGIPQDANLRVEVKLTIEGGSGEKKVVYIVGTDPQLTVFRKDFD